MKLSWRFALKILFVNVVDEFRKRRIEREFSNLGTSYLASYLRKLGGFSDITILDAGQSLKPNFLKNFDVIGISSVTQNFNIAKEIAEKAKNASNSLVLVGGHHITALPSNLTKDMDVAVLGEGEQTTLELVQAYERNEAKRLFDGLDFSKIKGIAYRDGGNLKVTAKRAFIEPLDKIPFPARDLMQLNSHHVQMFTSRGCPYKCVFCSSTFFWKTVRFFSASYVFDEICEVIEKYKPNRINFSDDLFIADKKRLELISKKCVDQHINKQVEFHCTARSNLINDEVASWLKAMNVTTVSMGLESGSNRILQYLKGGSVTVEQNEKAVNILKRHGLNVSATFIIGSPTETREEILQTYKFIQRSKLDAGDTYVLLPFPATQLWEYGKQIGELKDFMDWSRFEIYFEDNPYRIFLSNLSREELLVLLLKFKKLWRKRRRGALFEQAIKHPNKILPFIYRKLCKR